MLGIGAIIIAIWFYLSVQKVKRGNVWGWVTVGVFIYYISGALWIHGVLKYTLGHLYLTHDFAIQLAIKASGIVVGIIVCALVRLRFIIHSGH